jgi:hypothetical protein
LVDGGVVIGPIKADAGCEATETVAGGSAEAAR